jgi:3-methyladenine DNA glycosylase/8-oxoguanine DNA glycosylase
MEHVRVEVRPPWPFRLPHGGKDGVARRRGGVLERLVHVDGEPAVVRAAQPAPDRVVVGAWSAAGREVAAAAVARFRWALGVDEDLRAFHAAFARDPLIGDSVRRNPHLRVTRRFAPFEALAWAVCEQLITFERACAIERRIVVRWGRRCPHTGLRDLPEPATVAGIAPAELEGCDLAARRALTLRRVAREIAAGRIHLDGPDPEAGWRRLRALPGVGSWTIGVLALLGQGRYDVLPAGDLAYRKLVGLLDSGGDPLARADEQRVLDVFARFGPWAGLAGAHALRSSGLLGVGGGDVEPSAGVGGPPVSRRPAVPAPPRRAVRPPLAGTRS